ncbi:ABC transporter ATP-binding protein [Ectobacillus polymachus]|uniref:ABC transporter ATP-binding protein n=1 Tax=Ectobacillus polymachus TaxID=1508806 RepID=UPI003A87E8FE
MNFLSIKQVYHGYFTEQQASLVLANINIEANEGEFIAILGPSGCGKTTLLSVIAGLLQPLQGTVTIENELVTKTSSKIGYMLQQDYLFPWKTLFENVVTGLRITKSYNEESRTFTLNLLKEVGLQDVEHLYPSQLSGGMRQRAALVRTLATHPKLLLLDEPFSALDYQTKLKLEELVFSLLKKFQKTSILVTHDIEEAIAMSDRIFLLKPKPGRMAKEIIIPEEIRILSPLQARQHPSFLPLFQMIWKEFEIIEQ